MNTLMFAEDPAALKAMTIADKAVAAAALVYKTIIEQHTPAISRVATKISKYNHS